MRMRMVHGAEPLLLRMRRSVKKRVPPPVDEVRTTLVADGGANMP